MTDKDNMPTIISVDELAEKTANKLEEKMKPKAKPDSLNEAVDSVDYRTKAAEMLRDTNSNWKWTGTDESKASENKYFEAIGALSAGSAVPEIWAAEVSRCCPYPASAFWDAPFIKWHDDIKGKAGDTVHVVTVGKAVCGTAGCAEPASTAPTISACAITLEEYQCSLYICRDDLEDVVEGTITEVNNSLLTCLDNCIDNAFIANITGKGSTYIISPGTLTAALIAKAMGTMRMGTCEPVALIIHPVVEASLMQDSQFVNAATFGDRSVITGGHIIKYLGLDIIVVPKGSLNPGGTVTFSSLMLSQNAVHAAKKRDPSIESQYLVQTQRKYVYASVRFGKAVVCNSGVLWITSVV
jgi:hypothetical protein